MIISVKQSALKCPASEQDCQDVRGIPTVNVSEAHFFFSQDDEGRCYSDSFGELPELIERAKAEDDEQPSE